MLAKNKLKQTKSKYFILAAMVVCLLMGVSNAVAQNSNNKPRPEARLITSISSKDSKAASRDTNHPKVVSSSENQSVAPKSKATLDAIASFVPTAMEKKALDLINKERQRHGYAPLSFDPEICLVARMYSEKMAAKNFFSHVDPSGNDVQGRARNFGVRNWRAIGENLAFNQGYDDPVAFAVERWMVSPSHRSNILLAMWTATGIGIAKSEDDSYYITQVFITR